MPTRHPNNLTGPRWRENTTSRVRSKHKQAPAATRRAPSYTNGGRTTRPRGARSVRAHARRGASGRMLGQLRGARAPLHVALHVAHAVHACRTAGRPIHETPAA